MTYPIYLRSPSFILFAGVNGAGKSTFYKSDFWKKYSDDACDTRINPDEILQQFHGNTSNTSDQLKAGRIALSMQKNCLKKGISFNQETTLCGYAILNTIKEASKLNYDINMFYIGVDSAKIAYNRIENRVKRGGHFIDCKTVEKRFRNSMLNVQKARDFCNRILFIDNSENFTPLAIWEKETLCWWGGKNALKHNWFMRIIDMGN